ncbi:hypothetical protein Pen02_27820 [Plantactinospora endophytica]|uniref:Uncharacterized protein n=1 Tax=Plantactinospora endophytica TaxID=673535 RepID=A0ABQ4DZI0_9ACTN|nr:hypothetical protein Pen02_27820 [Plantactinospora endophytica]
MIGTAGDTDHAVDSCDYGRATGDDAVIDWIPTERQLDARIVKTDQSGRPGSVGRVRRRPGTGRRWYFVRREPDEITQRILDHLRLKQGRNRNSRAGLIPVWVGGKSDASCGTRVVVTYGRSAARIPGR